MYQHILLPTDGRNSDAGRPRGYPLREIPRARVTALHTTSQFYPSRLAPEIIVRAREYEGHVKEEVAGAWGGRGVAREAGVACTALHRASDNPWEEIIKVATEQGCDLIVMASHGRRGLSRDCCSAARPPRCSRTRRSPCSSAGNGLASVERRAAGRTG